MSKASHIIHCDIFKRGVVIVIGDRNGLKSELRKHGYVLAKATADEIDKSLSGYIATTMEIGEGHDVLVYAEKPMPLPVLAHELFHATQFITRFVGAEDVETSAYLYEYLLSSVLTSDDAVCALLKRDDASLQRLARFARSSRHAHGSASSRFSSSALKSPPFHAAHYTTTKPAKD